MSDYPLLYQLSEDGRMVIFCSDCSEEMDENDMIPANVYWPPLHINNCASDRRRPLLGADQNG